MPIIQDWVTFEIFVFCFAFPHYDVSSCESKLYYAYVTLGMALTGQKLDEQGNGYRSQPRSHFCYPLSKWWTMLIRRIDKKTRIGQGLKLS